MCTRILYVVSAISCYPATIVPKVDKCKGIVIIFTVELKLSARSEVTIPSSTCFPDTYSKQVDVLLIILNFSTEIEIYVKPNSTLHIFSVTEVLHVDYE